jgi:hypothetical protein
VFICASSDFGELSRAVANFFSVTSATCISSMSRQDGAGRIGRNPTDNRLLADGQY